MHCWYACLVGLSAARRLGQARFAVLFLILSNHLAPGLAARSRTALGPLRARSAGPVIPAQQATSRAAHRMILTC
jgi:hypothetical protein